MSALIDPMTHIEWMCQTNSDPWSKSQPPEWSLYSDVENLIIEEAFETKQTHAMLDGCYIDFKHSIQICNNDDNKQRPVKRLVRKKDDKRLRRERFMLDPIAPKRPFGGEYGWVSPFIMEVRKDLKFDKGQLPSRDETIVSMIVEKAVIGIIEEGKIARKQHEAEYMAKKLMEQQNSGIKEVWRCCAYLYSMNSFLYQKLNEAMRFIGSDEHEQVWRSKIRTLGPFCLLLWDDPFNNKLNTGKLLYRGAQLTDDQIITYKDYSGHFDEYRSFQAFTSCSRNRAVAEAFSGNALFIMQVLFAFTVDLSPFSEYPDEEEELITPGVCFTVQRVRGNNGYVLIPYKFMLDWKYMGHTRSGIWAISKIIPVDPQNQDDTLDTLQQSPTNTREPDENSRARAHLVLAKIKKMKKRRRRSNALQRIRHQISATLGYALTL
ncbi:unnamed protein product [Didymodactylos carnosus]|uniref:NAD(P)(+)--arginine ADP-ribosyltransferase n=1 Tax=Didymodactylos carnosus TaxID=1234261 RepID=A0A814QQ68_9BILA|nr:unnamed protein product [Didymodactylos carnosus]CAF3886412.1 unnamed protein product [Didymodactylos carnosus]